MGDLRTTRATWLYVLFGAVALGHHEPMGTDGTAGAERPESGGNARVLAGRYRLEGRLGQGGMGVVWRATDQLLGRQVAVKELPVDIDDALSDEELAAQRERTLREARALAQLGHPHIIGVHDVIEIDHRPYIVMELIDGPSLAEQIARGGPVAPREAARIGVALLGALRKAHASGVLHRDLKPANVLLETETGRVVLTDFGIAQVTGATTLTESGSFLGSPEYTAPERMTGARTGPESDLWSLGALLCAAVSGTSPFRRDSLSAVLLAVVSEEIRTPSQATPLLPVIHGLLERDPDLRIDAAQAEWMLRGYADTGRVPELPPGVTPLGRRGSERTWRTPLSARLPLGVPPKLARHWGSLKGKAGASGTTPHLPRMPRLPHRSGRRGASGTGEGEGASTRGAEATHEADAPREAEATREMEATRETEDVRAAEAARGVQEPEAGSSQGRAFERAGQDAAEAGGVRQAGERSGHAFAPQDRTTAPSDHMSPLPDHTATETGRSSTAAGTAATPTGPTSTASGTAAIPPSPEDAPPGPAHARAVGPRTAPHGPSAPRDHASGPLDHEVPDTNAPGTGAVEHPATETGTHRAADRSLWLPAQTGPWPPAEAEPWSATGADPRPPADTGPATGPRRPTENVPQPPAGARPRPRPRSVRSPRRPSGTPPQPPAGTGADEPAETMPWRPAVPGTRRAAGAGTSWPPGQGPRRTVHTMLIAAVLMVALAAAGFSAIALLVNGGGSGHRPPATSPAATSTPAHSPPESQATADSTPNASASHKPVPSAPVGRRKATVRTSPSP